MKINIDMENLAEIIERSVEKNTEEAINEAIKKLILEWMRENYADKIQEIVCQKAEEYIRDYVDHIEINVGGGLSDDEIKTVSLDSYVKSKFSEIIKAEMLTVKDSRGWGNSTKQITFKEYIDNNLNVSEIVKKELDPFLKDVKNLINYKVKETFEGSAKTMLSEAVYNVLMSNETYKKMQENIAAIASKG